MADKKTPSKKSRRADGPTAHLLDALHDVILSRKGGDPETSNTARLFARGRAKIAQKLGEEAVETVIEAVRGDTGKLAEESADLLYHLLVLWADAGLKPADVYAILQARSGISGIEEKRGRKAREPDTAESEG